jgi:uncharacterized protein (DUF488 family)
MTPFYTIGYEGCSIQGFLQTLTEFNIEQIIDIRRVPWSRKPGFAKKTLESHANNIGIIYTHIVDLGTPVELRAMLKEQGNYPEFFRNFRKYLTEHNDALASACDIALTRSSVLVCFERDHHTCHRLEVSNAMLKLSPSLHPVHLQISASQVKTMH